MFPFVYSSKSNEKDLLSLETGYHQKLIHDPMTNYYSPSPVPYNSYEEPPPQLEYIPHPYPAHETPKSDYVSNYYKNGPKKMTYPSPDSPYIKPYSSSASYPPSSYGYGVPPPKSYESYKPKQKYSSSYAMPIYQSEYMKYKPIKKMYKMSPPSPAPHPSVAYPIDDYYQYKQPDPYNYPPTKQSYPYQPEYQSYSTTKAYPPQTYSDYPKHSYNNYSPPPPTPSSYYSYEPKGEYPKMTYDDEPYYSSNNYPQKY